MADGACKKCLKILCIHGYRQSAKSCREKLGAFRKGLKKLPLEFVYITAPNKIPTKADKENSEAANTQDAEEYGWWFSTNEDTYDPLQPSNICKGYEDSLVLIKSAFAEQGPFDGVFSFSQGASMASIVCAMRDQGVFTFDFAILVAGFKSLSTQHEVFYTKPISCPSLHVYGDTDKVIPKENSEELVKCFVDPVTVNHPGGHFVPTSSQYRKTYTEFLEQFLK